MAGGTGVDRQWALRVSLTRAYGRSNLDILPFGGYGLTSTRGEAPVEGMGEANEKKNLPIGKGTGRLSGPFIVNIELPWYDSISSYDNCCYMHGGITVYYTRRAGYIDWSSTREAKQMAYRGRERRAINSQRFGGNGHE